MQATQRIETYLKVQKAPYRLLAHPATDTLEEAAAAAGVELNQMVRAVVLEDAAGLVMAILPANYMVDFAVLNRLLGRTLQPAARARLAAVFPDCEPRSIPPLAEPYGLTAVVDEQIALMQNVCFEPGSHGHLVCMEGTLFDWLHQDARRGVFSHPSHALTSPSTYTFTMPNGEGGLKKLHPVENMEQRVRALQALPPLPEAGRRLLLLRGNPTPTLAELTDIITLDPVLAAQVVNYARSAYYGYHGKVETLHDAIGVLGIDAVLHMVLGLSAARTLRAPVDGPLGLYGFWRHAVHTAALAEALGTLLPAARRGRAGMAYLAGLLHDFGFLALGHLFKAEYFLLNKVVAANPDVPVTLIEKRVLGFEHTQLGSWALAHWTMPQEVVIAAREHHNEYYHADHAGLANLVLLAEHLLKATHFSDAAAAEPPPAIYTALGLDKGKVRELTARVLEHGAYGLDDMARALAD